MMICLRFSCLREWSYITYIASFPIPPIGFTFLMNCYSLLVVVSKGDISRRSLSLQL